jgi:hypothetical protein
MAFDLEKYMGDMRTSTHMDRHKKSDQMERLYPSGLYPANASESDRQARKYFDVDSASQVSSDDINAASNLLGMKSELSKDGRGQSWSIYDDEGYMDRALRKVVDAPFHDHSNSYKREDAPLNNSLLDPLYAASSALQSGVEGIAPRVSEAIDGADAWLFDKTGGLLGTPKSIKPKHQLQLRKGFRDELDFDQSYADGLGIGYDPR